MKPKLTIDEQIEHMRNKGIRFEIISETDAKKFISENTYFFKIKSYAKNYPKNSVGKYINLDFAALQELSIIDMHLRRIILSITLNIEHAIKTHLNHHCCSNDAEDGYSIVASFRDTLHYTDIRTNRYTKSMVTKYESNYALWNYLEVISFGTLCDFYGYYFHIYDIEKANFLNPFLYSIKMLRNIAAHNNCLLNNLIPNITNTISPIYALTTYMGHNRNFSKKQLTKLKIPIFHDFAAMLFILNQNIKSDKMLSHTYEDLDMFLERINRNIHYFDKHLDIKNNLLFFEKIVDFFKKNT